jgi:hypothetical protein
MATYADLFDDLVAIKTGVKNNERAIDYDEETAFSLVDDGDVAGLRLWLRSNPHMGANARNVESGRSLLHHASANGQKEVVKLLLQRTETNLMLRTMLVRRPEWALCWFSTC